jgi:hypothetical protein
VAARKGEVEQLAGMHLMLKGSRLRCVIYSSFYCYVACVLDGGLGACNQSLQCWWLLFTSTSCKHSTPRARHAFHESRLSPNCVVRAQGVFSRHLACQFGQTHITV